MLSANEVASVIIARSDTAVLDGMSLQKLLYYSQAWHLAITGERLFSEQVKAWVDGPVVPQVWHERKSDRRRQPSLQDTAAIALDELSSDVIDLVLKTYGRMGPADLSALTHSERPWIEARGDTPPSERSHTAVKVDTMAEFYRNERTLGGRTAADLAAGGIHLHRSARHDRIDVAALLAEIDEPAAATDPWGGANLHAGSNHASTR